jgi:hypothetical protein
MFLVSFLALFFLIDTQNLIAQTSAQYRLITGTATSTSNIEAFNNQISRALNEGFKLHGETFTALIGNTTFFCQAMIK